MKRSFLHTEYTYSDSTGIPTRVHPDCDSLPVVLIYNSDGEYIETPIVTKTTTFYATGHYTYPLNPALYVKGSWYYEEITFVYDSITMEAERGYFCWGMTNEDIAGDATLGYNNNLLRCLRVTLQENTDLVTLLGHNPPTDPRIFVGHSYVNDKPQLPCLTYDLFDQRPLINPNIGTIRETTVLFNFWHKGVSTTTGTEFKNKQLLRQLNDNLITYMSESNIYQGASPKSNDNLFFTFNVEYYDSLASPIGDTWLDETKGLISIGSMFKIKAACH